MANNFTIASFVVDNTKITCCVMQYDKDAQFGAQFPIIDWRLIDTSDTAILSGRPCDGITTTGTRCTRAPSVVVEDSCYCERHSFQNSKSIPNIKFRRMPLKKICMKLVESLKELNDMWLKRIDHVVIESQYLTNRRTMCVSDIIYGYFITNHLLNSESRVNDIKFVSADSKWKVYDGPEITTVDYHCNTKDKLRQFSIAQCINMIEKDEPNLKYFNTFAIYSHKFNLSDTFLQGAAYLKTIQDPLVKKIISDGKYEIVNIPVRPAPFVPKPRKQYTPRKNRIKKTTPTSVENTSGEKTPTSSGNSTELLTETIEPPIQPPTKKPRKKPSKKKPIEQSTEQKTTEQSNEPSNEKPIEKLEKISKPKSPPKPKILKRKPNASTLKKLAMNSSNTSNTNSSTTNQSNTNQSTTDSSNTSK